MSFVHKENFFFDYQKAPRFNSGESLANQTERPLPSKMVVRFYRFYGDMIQYAKVTGAATADPSNMADADTVADAPVIAAAAAGTAADAGNGANNIDFQVGSTCLMIQTNRVNTVRLKQMWKTQAVPYLVPFELPVALPCQFHLDQDAQFDRVQIGPTT